MLDPDEYTGETDEALMPDPEYLPLEDIAMWLTQGMKDNIERALKNAYERGLRDAKAPLPLWAGEA